MTADIDRLNEYIRTRRGELLEPLVRHHLDWVHSSAVRQLRGDTHLAADVAQAVFLTLAQKPPRLRDDAALAAWLFGVTRFISYRAIRSEVRRRRHEGQAAMIRHETLNPSQNFDESWRSIAPLLDQAISRLSENDRCSVLLRFFQGRSYVEVGDVLGISEEAARKRVDRAIDKLKEMLAAQGVAAPGTAALAAGLLASAVSPAPSAVAASTLAAVSGGTASSVFAASLSKGVITMINVKFVGMAAAILLTPIIGIFVLAQINPTRQAAAPAPAPASQPSAGFNLDGTANVLASDQNGQPVSGADVYVVENVYASMNANDLKVSTAGPVRTGANGIARIPGLSSLKGAASYTRYYYLRVPGEKVGFDMESQSIVAPAEPKVPFIVRMVNASPVSGTISVPPGFRPQDVRVRLMNASIRGQGPLPFIGVSLDTDVFEKAWPGMFRTSVDPEGKFVFTDLPGGQARVCFAAEGPGLGQAQLMVSREESRPVQLQMSREAVVAGSIRYTDGSRPAGSVTLLLTPRMDLPNTSPRRTTSGNNGEFRFAGLAEGVYSLKADLLNLEGWTMPVREGIRVDIGQTLEKTDVQLERGVVVSGKVQSSTGQAARDVQITALNPATSGSEGIASAMSRDDGSFSMRLPVGSSMLYVSSVGIDHDHPKNQAQRVVTITHNDKIEGDLAFVVPPARKREPIAQGKIIGQVVDDQSRPVANVKIGDQRREPLFEYSLSDPNAATTDAQGKFEIAATAGILHGLFISTPDYSGRIDNVLVPANGQIEVSITATPQPVVSRIEGIVVDPKGNPIPSVTVNGVRASDPNAILSDALGRFSVPVRDTSKPFTMLMSKSGFEMRNWNDLPTDARALRFVLHPTSRPSNAQSYGTTPLIDSAILVGGPAPALDVESWVFLPNPNNPPQLNNGRRTLLMFIDNDPKAADQIRSLQQIAMAADAQAVALFNPYTHEATARARLKDLQVSASVGIDRYFPDNPYRTNGATHITYGESRMRNAPSRIWLIGPDGVIASDQFQPGR